MKPTRAAFIAACMSLEGVLYRWGGKSPRGLDCSGLVTWALKSQGGPDLRQTHNADALRLRLPPIIEPRAGDLAFYGTSKRATHVVVCLGGPHDQIIGANGGDSSTLTEERAQAQGARVKRATSPAYRRDFLGYGSMSQLLEDA